jgi:hypothetical protein
MWWRFFKTHDVIKPADYSRDRLTQNNDCYWVQLCHSWSESKPSVSNKNSTVEGRIVIWTTSIFKMNPHTSWLCPLTQWILDWSASRFANMDELDRATILASWSMFTLVEFKKTACCLSSFCFVHSLPSPRPWCRRSLIITSSVSTLQDQELCRIT